ESGKGESCYIRRSHTGGTNLNDVDAARRKCYSRSTDGTSTAAAAKLHDKVGAEMMRATLPIVYVLLTLCSRSVADSFLPFVDQHIDDPTGAYYVLLKRSAENPRGMKENAVDVLIVKRARTVSARRGAWRRGSETHSVSVGPGDEVVGQAVLEPPPAHVLVSSSASLVVFLDSYGHNYKVAENKETAVRVLRGNGKLKTSINLGNLFRA